MKRYKILVGPNKGEILEGEDLGVALTLIEREEWNSGKKIGDTALKRWEQGIGDGVWIYKLNRRFALKTEVEDQVVPLDVLGSEIFVGDVIVYAKRNLTVSKLRVGEIGVMVFDGERTLYGIDLHSNKKTKISYPSRCLKI
jgi:hypothetical protein